MKHLFDACWSETKYTSTQSLKRQSRFRMIGEAKTLRAPGAMLIGKMHVSAKHNFCSPRIPARSFQSMRPWSNISKHRAFLIIDNNTVIEEIRAVPGKTNSPPAVVIQLLVGPGDGPPQSGARPDRPRLCGPLGPPSLGCPAKQRSSDAPRSACRCLQ